MSKTGPSRRDLLRVAGLGSAALATLPGSVLLGGQAEAATLPPVPLSGDPVLHLVRRATYGPTVASVAHARALGRTAWVDEQLAPWRMDDSTCLRALARFPALSMTCGQMASHGRNNSWNLMQQVQLGAFLRQTSSTRQLHEMVVEFWADHFAVQVPSEKVWLGAIDLDRTVLRGKGLGRFADLLVAVTSHPAMLAWLDNDTSHRDAPNENLGRELLELHTVGSGAGYGEADVAAAARVLTGWSFDQATGASVFRAEWHDTQPVQVMGFRADNRSATGGRQVGLDLLAYLARHPATARRIAHKLAVRFVRDDPPATLVQQLADTYLAHDTAIAPVLRQLLLSSEFAASTGLKTRRPGEDAAATVRVLGGRPSLDTQVAAWSGWRWAMAEAGHAPRGWPEPNGYPDDAASWTGAAAIIGRWNMHQGATGGSYGAGIVYPSLGSLVGARRPTTVGALVDALSRRVLFQTLSAHDRAVIIGFTGATAGAPVPSFWYDFRIKLLITLLLDSPYFALR